VSFVLDVFFGRARPRFGSPYDEVIGITLWGCSWLCAISGVRHATGRARVAAWVGLAVLLLHSGLILVLILGG
jgi:hypothetical protein